MTTLSKNKTLAIPFLAFLALALSWVIYMGKLPVIAAIIVMPFVVYMVYLLFDKPQTGLILVLVLSFIINGLGRYITMPFSLFIDGVLLSVVIAALFHSEAEDYKRLGNILVLAVSVWMFYSVMEIFNPESIGILPWFYASRSVSIYLFIMVILTFLVFKTQRSLHIFMVIWCIGGIVSAAYGIKQSVIGLDSAELAWLAAGAAQQHVLFGKLRIFSFYSDAGQFGAFMSFTSLTMLIAAVRAENFTLRMLYLFTGVITGYGMLISGTRGALFVYVGAMVYFLLDKNFKTFAIGLFVLGSIFFLLRFTYIGASNYNIQRMRSAVRPQDDASFQVRLENQKKFGEYLSTRPFGGGIGSSGYWGQRFKPGSFLAETPTDSWFVRIWAETGMVGLVIYIGMLLAILVGGFVQILNLRDVYLKQKLCGIYAGVLGVLLASYGNQVIGQFPTMVVFSMGLSLIFMGKMMDQENNKEPMSSKHMAP